MNMPTQFQSRMPAQRTVALLPDRIGLGGARAGLAGGGLAMTLIGALLTHALDQDRWLQLKVIASVVLGPAVAAQLGYEAGPIIIGALMQLGLAALLGVLFELLMRRIARRPEVTRRLGLNFVLRSSPQGTAHEQCLPAW